MAGLDQRNSGSDSGLVLAEQKHNSKLERIPTNEKS